MDAVSKEYIGESGVLGFGERNEEDNTYNFPCFTSYDC